MLLEFINALLDSTKKDTEPFKKTKGNGKKKLTPKEKDKLEYELWVRAEEYEEEE